MKALEKFDQEKPQIDLALAWLAQCDYSLETAQLTVKYITNISKFSLLKYRSHEERINHLKLGISTAEHMSDLKLLATFYRQLGTTYYEIDRYEQSIEALQKQLAISQEINDVELEISALEQLGPAKTYIGEFETAIQHLNKSIELSRKHGIKTNNTTIYGSLGLAYQAIGNLDQAVAYFRTQLEINLNHTDPDLQAEGMLNLGAALGYKGELKESISVLTKGLKFSQKIKSPLGEALCYSGIAYAFLKLERYNKAISYYSKQLSIFKETKNMLRIAICQSNLAEAYALSGNLKAAEEMIQEALSSPERTKIQRWNIYILNRHANVLREQGALEVPKSLYEAVIAFNTQSGEMDYVAQAEIDYARLLQRHGFAQEALAHATSAMEIYRSCGADFFADQIGAWIAKHNLGADAPGELR